MIDVIKSQLKERSHLTKAYYKYGKRKPDFEKLIVKMNVRRLFQLQKINILFKCMKN